MPRLPSIVVLCLALLLCSQCKEETVDSDSEVSSQDGEADDTESTSGDGTTNDKGSDEDAVSIGVPDTQSLSASFIVFGDWGAGPSDQLDVASAIGQYCVTEACEFILTLGDNFYDAGISSINDLQWKEKYRDIYGPLGIPFYAALGNHDNAGNVQAEIDYSSIDSSWHMPAENYTFCWPEEQKPCLVEFFVFNSVNFDQAVADWLESALTWSDARWRILAMHHFLYGNAVDSIHYGDDPLGYNDILLPVICDQVDLVLSAHIHAFSYLQTDEDGCLINQIILGTGGHPDLSSVREDDPRVLTTKSLHGFGWFQINLENVLFRMVQTDGTVFYSSSWNKP